MYIYIIAIGTYIFHCNIDLCIDNTKDEHYMLRYTLVFACILWTVLNICKLT